MKNFAIVGIVSACAIGGIVFLSGKSKSNKHLADVVQAVETARESIQGDKLWYSDFEQKLDQEKKTRQQELDLSKHLIKAATDDVTQQTENFKNTVHDELKNLREELAAVRQEKNEAMQILNAKIEASKKTSSVIGSEMVLAKTIEAKADNSPKDINGYLPAGTYVTGRLLNGVVASTGVRAQEEPHPITIKLTGSAKLPNLFEYDLKFCHVVASAKGNLSSERVLIRLETLSCVDKKQKAVETKIAGHVVGPDGIEGIKGTVISMDSKYVTNAAIGGILGGLAGAVSPQAPSNQLRLVTDRSIESNNILNNLGQGAASSASSSINSVADYYLKFAESIQPVVQIPAGVEIDIVFLQGVSLGSKNIARVISNERTK